MLLFQDTSEARHNLFAIFGVLLHQLSHNLLLVFRLFTPQHLVAQRYEHFEIESHVLVSNYPKSLELPSGEQGKFTEISMVAPEHPQYPYVLAVVSDHLRSVVVLKEVIVRQIIVLC